MIIGCLNIRGGSRVKRRRISHSISKCNANLFLIIETKLNLICEFVLVFFLGIII